MDKEGIYRGLVGLEEERNEGTPNPLPLKEISITLDNKELNSIPHDKGQGEDGTRNNTNINTQA